MNHQKMPRAWLIVVLLFFVALLNYIDRTMITTMRSSIVASIPMTDAQFGLLTSVFLWVYGLLSPVAGFLADKFKRSSVIIVSLLVWSTVTWLTSYSVSFEQLLLTRALMGISEACYIPAALALIADYHSGPTRSLATGIHMAGIMAGQSLGFVGGWVAEQHEWHAAFKVFGIFGICYALVLLLLLRDAPKHQATVVSDHGNRVRFLDALKHLFSNRMFVLVVSFFGLVSIMTWLVIGWLPTYFKEQFNLSQTVAGIYSTGYIFTSSIIGVLLGGFLADVWSRRNARARIWVPALGLAAAAPAIFFASYTTWLPLALACFITYAIAKSFSDSNAMPILCLIVDPKYRATGYGILNCCGCLVGGIGLYAGGALRDSQVSLSTIYQSASLVIVAASIILFMVKPSVTEDRNQ